MTYWRMVPDEASSANGIRAGTQAFPLQGWGATALTTSTSSLPQAPNTKSHSPTPGSYLLSSSLASAIGKTGSSETEAAAPELKVVARGIAKGSGNWWRGGEKEQKR